MALPFDFEVALIALEDRDHVAEDSDILSPLLKELADAALSSRWVSDTDLAELQQRKKKPLHSHYLFVWFTEISSQIDLGPGSRCAPLYIVSGLNLEGDKEVMGLYSLQGSETDFWHHVLMDLNDRGLEDVLISMAAIDKSKGFLEAIDNVFPQTDVQLCVNHQIQSSLGYVAGRDRDAFLSSLKPICQAPNKGIAEAALEQLERRWGGQYPIAIKSWRNKWKHLSTHFKYPADIRRVVYGPNPVESLCGDFRDNTKHRETFFQDKDSFIKLLYTRTRKAS